MPRKPDALARAWKLYESSRYELAIESAMQALAHDPDAAEPRQVASLCLTRLKRFDEAERFAKEALMVESDEAYAHHVLGFACYFRAVAIDESLPQALKESGTQSRAIDTAAGAYREAIRIEPGNAFYHEMLGFVLFHDDKDEQAEASAREAIRLDPNRSESFSLLADICRSTRRYKEAHHYALRSLAADANRSGSHAALGWAKLMHGDAKESLGLFREAMRLDPNDPYARRGLAESLKVQHAFIRLPYRALNWLTDLSMTRAWGWYCVGIVAVFCLFLVASGQFANPDIGQLLPGLLVSVFIGLFMFFVLRFFPVYAMSLLVMCNVVLLLYPMGRHALTPWQRYRAVALAGYILPVAAMILMVVVSGMMGKSPALEHAAQWVVALVILAGPLGAWAAALTTRWAWPTGIIAGVFVLGYLWALVGLPGASQLRADTVPQVALLVGIVWGLIVPSRL